MICENAPFLRTPHLRRGSSSGRFLLQKEHQRVAGDFDVRESASPSALADVRHLGRRRTIVALNNIEPAIHVLACPQGTLLAHFVDPILSAVQVPR